MEVETEYNKGYRLYMEDHLKFLMESLKDCYHKLDFVNYHRVRKQIDQLRSVMNSIKSTTSAQRCEMSDE
jgi:hypothetical protein